MFKKQKSSSFKTNRKIVGIDLGTTFSSVAIYQNQKVFMIPNDQGKKATSSYIAFTQTQRLIGDSAFNQTARNPINTIYQFKRLLGRKFSDLIVQQDIKKWPFIVQSGQEDRPIIVVNFKNEVKRFYPQQIEAMVLSKLKSMVQKFVGQQIKDAIITVPANFTDGQRQATKDAGKIAGLNVVRILSQPIAAAIAYGYQKCQKVIQNILVFDLGGGTLDISILTIDQGVFQVKSTSGDTHLGGVDFDNKIVQHCAKIFFQKKGIDIRKNQRAMRRLKTECQKAKRILSSSNQVTIEVDALCQNEDFSLNLNRAKFQELCKQQFQRIIIPVQKAIQDSGLKIEQINEVVLVGGSTRIPKITQILKGYLKGKQPNRSVNLDQAVVFGAAIQAAILAGQLQKNILVIDAVPFSIGIQTQGGIMSVIVAKNTPIPTKKSLKVTTSSDNQESLSIVIFEGENKYIKNNRLLGSFQIKQIPPGPRGVYPIQVSLEIDQNGIMKVHVSKENRLEISKLLIQNRKGRLSNIQIAKSIKQAQKYKKQDQNMIALIEAKNDLQSCCNKMKERISQLQNWMRDGNNNKNLNDYMKKLSQLQDLGKTVKKRKI